MFKVSSQNPRVRLFSLLTLVILCAVLPIFSNSKSVNRKPARSIISILNSICMQSQQTSAVIHRLKYFPILMQLENITLDSVAQDKEIYTPTFFKQAPIRRFAVSTGR